MTVYIGGPVHRFRILNIAITAAKCPTARDGKNIMKPVSFQENFAVSWPGQAISFEHLYLIIYSLMLFIGQVQ